MLNPKIAVSFTSLLSQFAGTHGSWLSLLVLGFIFNALGLGCLTSYASAAARGRNVPARARVKRTLDGQSGVVLVGLGARLALERSA